VEDTGSDPSGTASLAKIDHVVVVMLENRSFDHLLGYLSLTGRRPEIDGLRPGLANAYQEHSYPVHHLSSTALDLDPDHSAGAIDQQIAGGKMSGFAASAAATLAARGMDDGDPGCVMGYYDGDDVPVYDHLAEEFAVCDRWFSSVPGATLPNRLYALCGAAAGSRDDRPSYVPPLYHQPSFVRHLDTHRVSWRWYSFDPGTLRLADVQYRLGHHQRFGYFSKTGLPWRTALDNVLLGLQILHADPKQADATARQWLTRLGLAGHESDYPHALSGGMRQRVSIARAFAVDPEILLCDEPFSSLDEMTARDLRAEFVRLVRQNGKTAIFITHQINEAMEIGDRVLVFHRPARIAYEARLDGGMNADTRRNVHEDIMRVLAREEPAQAANGKA